MAELLSSHRFCVAPMMDWTDRHCRAFHRSLSVRARLYTEMLTPAALHYGHRERLLGFSPVEHPVALQLGGSDPAALAAAARLGEEWGYDEVNLNCGCPSDRVQAGRFGACLMAEPALVADCVAAMRSAVAVPVTVKCRIGIDHQNGPEALFVFVETVAASGCQTFVVHARKAWLQGLSPRENRTVPPLDYPLVFALKRAFPQLTIVLNGGITTLSETLSALPNVDGVMLGRAAYYNPGLLAQVDNMLFGAPASPSSPAEIALAMLPYVEQRLAAGDRLSAVTRHMLGLGIGAPGARAFRRILTEDSLKPGAGAEVLRRAAAAFAQPASEVCAAA